MEYLKSPNFNLITNISPSIFFDHWHNHSSPENHKQASNYYKELLHSQKWKSKTQIFSFRSRGTLLCKGTLWIKEQVHWRRHHQDARVSIWQHFRGLRRKGFRTDNRHSHGHKLCPSTSRHISVLIRSGIHMLCPCSRLVGNGWHLSSTPHTDTSMTYCPLITLTLKIISVRCIPLNLISKTRRRAALLLLTWIYSCQSVGRSTSHFHLRQAWRF